MAAATAHYVCQLRPPSHQRRRSTRKISPVQERETGAIQRNRNHAADPKRPDSTLQIQHHPGATRRGRRGARSKGKKVREQYQGDTRYASEKYEDLKGSRPIPPWNMSASTPSSEIQRGEQGGATPDLGTALLVAYHTTTMEIRRSKATSFIFSRLCPSTTDNK